MRHPDVIDVPSTPEFEQAGVVKAPCPPRPIDVLAGAPASALDARIWDPSKFVASRPTLPLFDDVWAVIEETTSRASDIRRWRSEGIRLSEFWRPFKGTFAGVEYDGSSRVPPSRHFSNNPALLSSTLVGPPGKQVEAAVFVRAEIQAWLRFGAVVRWVDHPAYHPVLRPRPHIVCPLGIEPNKPRLFWDGRYPNLFQREVSFVMEHLGMIPPLMLRRAFQFLLDHMKGFYHLFMNVDEQTFLGFCIDSVDHVYTVPPFGWIHSSLVYNIFTHALVSPLREWGLTNFYYTDDIHGSSHWGVSDEQRLRAAHGAAFLTIMLHTAAGYTLSIKAELFPALVRKFLGLLVDADVRRFRIPEDKLQVFLVLVEQAFAAGEVEFRQLERIAGKAVSYTRALPGAMFFTRGLFRALAGLRRTGQRAARFVDFPDMVADLSVWRDLRRWHNLCASTWPKNFHTVITIWSDASSGLHAADPEATWQFEFEPRWGGVVLLPGESVPRVAGGVFPFKCRGLHINVLELLGLLYTLRAFQSFLRDARVSPRIDNTVAQAYVNRQGGSSPQCTAVALQIFEHQLHFGYELGHVDRVTSEHNPADVPSRVVDRGDHRLNPAIFHSLFVHPAFGCSWPFQGFSVDWMASARNVQARPDGSPLPFFSWLADVGCAGVNFFAQDLRFDPVDPSSSAPRRPSNGYLNPIWKLIPHALAYVEESQARGTIIVPRLEPLPAWWPVVMSPRFARAIQQVASKGDLNVFLHPSCQYRRSVGPVPFDVFAVAFDFS